MVSRSIVCCRIASCTGEESRESNGIGLDAIAHKSEVCCTADSVDVTGVDSQRAVERILPSPSRVRA